MSFRAPFTASFVRLEHPAGLQEHPPGHAITSTKLPGAPFFAYAFKIRILAAVKPLIVTGLTFNLSLTIERTAVLQVFLFIFYTRHIFLCVFL